MSLSALPENRFIDVNESFLRLFEYTREEVIGHTSLELGLWRNPAAREALVQKVRTGAPIRSVELSLLTKTGQTRHVIISIETLPLGPRGALLSAAVDITEKKDLERVARTDRAVPPRRRRAAKRGGPPGRRRRGPATDPAGARQPDEERPPGHVERGRDRGGRGPRRHGRVGRPRHRVGDAAGRPRETLPAVLHDETEGAGDRTGPRVCEERRKRPRRHDRRRVGVGPGDDVHRGPPEDPVSAVMIRPREKAP